MSELNQVDLVFCLMGFFLCIPTHRDGDVKECCCRELQRKEVVDLSADLYTNIGYVIVWCLKFIFIPIGVGVTVKLITVRLLQPQPERQRKKRFK
jgi:hypothetical protein